MSDINVGDRVRVVLEGEIRLDRDIDGEYLVNVDARHCGEDTLYINPDKVVSFEKVAPPVVTFKSGDIVRERETGALLAIGSGGFIDLGVGDYFRTGATFTSENFDKVEVAA